MKNWQHIHAYYKYILIILGLLVLVIGIWLMIRHTWGLQGYYYTNTDWQGDPAIVRKDYIPYLRGSRGKNLLATNRYSVRWQGWMMIPQTGTYTFATNSDDGSYFRINGETLVKNGGSHGLRKVTQKIVLDKGVYPIEVLYFQAGGHSAMETLWALPGKTEQRIPSPAFFPTAPNTITLIVSQGVMWLLSRKFVILWGLILVCTAVGLIFFDGISTFKTLFLALRPHLRFSQIQQTKSELWGILLSGALSILVYVNYFSNLEHLPLTNFRDRSIGIAVVSGADTSARTGEYIRTILMFMLVYGIVWIICMTLNYCMNCLLPRFYVKVEKSVLAIISAFAIATTGFAILTNQAFLKDVVKLLFVFIGLTFMIMFIKLFSYHRQRLLLKYLTDYALIVFSFMSSYVLFFIYWVFSHRELRFTTFYIYLYVLFVLAFLLLYPLIVRRITYPRRTLNNALIIAGIPLAAIPLSIPLSNELQFTLSGIWDLAPETVASAVILLLIGLSFIGFYIALTSSKIRWASSKIITTWYFPLFLASIYVFTYHSHIVSFDSFVLFHHGEMNVPTQQLFNFGALPFIDILPTHGISDMLAQTLYSLFNGYRGLEMQMWSWIVGTIEIILFYNVLYRLTTPLFALLTALLTPGFAMLINFESGVPDFPGIALLPIIVLCYAMRKPTWLRYTLLWLSVVFVFLWRYDFGIAAMSAMLCVLGGRYVCTKTPYKQAFIPLFVRPLVAGIGVFGTLLVLYSMLAFIKGRSVIDLLVQFLEFIKIQAPAQAFASIYSDFSSLVVWQYMLLPLVATLYILYFFLKGIRKTWTGSRTHIILLFLAAFSLVMSVRSVQRHCLLEGYTPYVFSLLLCAVPLYFANFKKQYAQLLFLGIFFLYLLVFPTPGITLFKAGRLFDFQHWRNKESRLWVKDDSDYANLVKFFDQSANKEQTFFDFTNAPLLYVFANRKFPTYIIPNLYHASEKVQHSVVQHLEDLYQDRHLPFVIFKQEDWWDAIDGVPNEIRSYRVAEFIYKHYFPLGKVDRYEIWQANDSTGPAADFLPAAEIFQRFDLKKLPYLWGTYDEFQATIKTEILDTFVLPENNIQPNTPHQLGCRPDIDKTSGNYLHFKIRSETDGQVTLRYGTETPATISFDVVGSRQEEEYLVRISSQWAWMKEPISVIAFEASVPIQLKEAFIRKGD